MKKKIIFIFLKTRSGFAMQRFHKGMADGHVSCFGNCICQPYFLGIGNIYVSDDDGDSQSYNSDDKSSGTIS